MSGIITIILLPIIWIGLLYLCLWLDNKYITYKYKKEWKEKVKYYTNRGEYHPYYNSQLDTYIQIFKVFKSKTKGVKL